MKNNLKITKVKSITMNLILVIFLGTSLLAQEQWDVPEVAKSKISFRIFNDDIVDEGRVLYDASCLSCHGNPTQADFTLMVPSPGDPGADSFQSQTDGALFYKILKGRGLMPWFEEAFSEDEIWSVVAYFRSFNEAYKQPLPDLTGIVIPELELELIFDDNIDKLVVKVFDEDNPANDVEVSAYVKAMFGNFRLGKSVSGKKGLAYFDVDPDMPGDSVGNLNIIVKAKKGYGFAKVTKLMKIGTPNNRETVIEGRHVWSTDAQAPLWMKFSFFIVILGIWGVLAYVVYIVYDMKKNNIN